jgi:hypothetical protein
MQSVANSALLRVIALAGLVIAAPTLAAEKNNAGVVQGTPPAIPQKPHVPPLALSDADHAKIAQAVSAKDTEVTFTLKATKAAKSYQPAVGAAIPKQLKPHPLPRPLVNEMPALKQYTYLKLKHQVLIVDPMTRKVVDLFPEAAGT